MMELSGRPLLDTKPDRDLFVDRADELGEVRRSADRGLNVLIVGDRGIGKTSLLRQLKFGLRENQSPHVFVEGRTATDAGSFLDLLGHELRTASQLPDDGGLERGGWAPASLVERVRSLRPRSTSGQTREQQVVLLVDSMPGAEAAHTLFGRLRDELWQLPYTWVVVADDERQSYLTPPADAFFERVVALGPLPRAASHDLLRRRMGTEAHGRIEALVELSDGNPRHMLEIAREVVARGLDPYVIGVGQMNRSNAIATLGRSASMLASELEALGPRSASDQDLLRRLGWTRERAVQVFKALEGLDLVTSTLEKHGTGRPRKVYALRGPEDFA